MASVYLIGKPVVKSTEVQVVEIVTFATSIASYVYLYLV